MSVVVERKLGFIGSTVVRYGMGYGAVAAMILSHSLNHSIFWMLIDGWLSWIYVIFYALFRSPYAF
jgi:hypothetical protein